MKFMYVLFSSKASGCVVYRKAASSTAFSAHTIRDTKPRLVGTS